MNVNRINICFVIITLPAILISCVQETQLSEDYQAGNMITGTITYIDLEGGFYGIIDDNENKYNPVNLAPDLQKNGIRIKARITILKNTSTIRMWGTVIRIEEINIL